MKLTIEVPVTHCLRCETTHPLRPQLLRYVERAGPSANVARDDAGGAWAIQGAELPRGWTAAPTGDGHFCPACTQQLAQAIHEFINPPPPESQEEPPRPAGQAIPVLVVPAVGPSVHVPLPSQAARTAIPTAIRTAPAPASRPSPIVQGAEPAKVGPQFVRQPVSQVAPNVTQAPARGMIYATETSNAFPLAPKK